MVNIPWRPWLKNGVNLGVDATADDVASNCWAIVDMAEVKKPRACATELTASNRGWTRPAPTAIGQYEEGQSLAALILTLILAFVMAGLWIVVGSRLQFVDDSRENDLANLVV